MTTMYNGYARSTPKISLLSQLNYGLLYLARFKSYQYDGQKLKYRAYYFVILLQNRGCLCRPPPCQMVGDISPIPVNVRLCIAQIK